MIVAFPPLERLSRPLRSPIWIGLAVARERARRSLPRSLALHGLPGSLSSGSSPNGLPLPADRAPQEPQGSCPRLSGRGLARSLLPREGARLGFARHRPPMLQPRRRIKTGKNQRKEFAGDCLRQTPAHQTIEVWLRGKRHQANLSSEDPTHPAVSVGRLQPLRVFRSALDEPALPLRGH